MKTFEINLQTTIYFDNDYQSIIAAYNKHTNILVINKPLIDGIELGQLKIKHEPNEVFKTDSFSLSFYNHRTGGNADFAEIKADQ